MTLKVAVIAAGAWGTALALNFCARHTVTLYTRDAALAQQMREQRENVAFLPGFPLPEALRISSELGAACADADVVVVATPLSGLRPTLRRLRDRACLRPLVWVCKGLEAGSALLPHQVVAQEWGDAQPSGVLSGPSFAQEVARGLPTAVTLASADARFARDMALALHSPHLRIYANDDLTGVEVGGAVKNVMAIATGICDGLELGFNARAALVTRGLAEIARLGAALGGQPATFMGLAGMGDLILTCTGDLSRNRQVGIGLAAGRTLGQILADLGHVAEGVSTAHEVARLAQQRGIDMPITQAVDAVLHGEVAAADAVKALLARDPKVETI